MSPGENILGVDRITLDIALFDSQGLVHKLLNTDNEVGHDKARTGLRRRPAAVLPSISNVLISKHFGTNVQYLAS
jgi:hypothetical protein